MWYQWIFWDGEECSFAFFEGADLYEVNKKAFNHYTGIVEWMCKGNSDYQDFLEDYYPNQYIRRTLFEFCLDKPAFIPNPCGGYTEITFHTINFKEVSV